MKTNRFTKRASGLCLALMAGFFVLCTTTASFGQITINNTASCFSLAASSDQTPACGQVCNGSNCDNCATFDMTNTSSNCDITKVEITCNTSGVCWSTCCALVFGSPDSTVCSDQPKSYNGHFPPSAINPPPHIARFTICYSGAGPYTFKIVASGVANGPGTNDCCPAAPASGSSASVNS